MTKHISMSKRFNKDRRFVMFGDMSNIKQYVLDKKDNERLDSKRTLMNKLNELAEENEQLKSQLYCDDEEGICNICKHHYLIKDDESELGYYNSRCKKGHYECARISLKYCEDFEKELEE